MQKLALSKSEELEKLSARSGALEDSLRSLGSALLTQVLTVLLNDVVCSRFMPRASIVNPAMPVRGAGGGIVGPVAHARKES